MYPTGVPDVAHLIHSIQSIASLRRLYERAQRCPHGKQLYGRDAEYIAFTDLAHRRAAGHGDYVTERFVCTGARHSKAGAQSTLKIQL